MKGINKDQEQRILAEVSAQEAWKHVEYFSTLDRLSGGPGEAQAARYVKETLERYGLTAEFHEFDSFLSYPGPTSLEVISPDQRSIHARTRSFSAPTPPEGIEGELVYVGTANGDDYSNVDVRGKIALGVGGGPGGLKAAEDSGALAQIHIWPSGEDVVHEMIVTTVWGTPTPESVGRIPKVVAIGVKRSDGEYLRSLCSRGPVRVRIKADVETGWKRVPLPTGTIRGKEEPDRYLLVGSHLDSWYLGTTDNATGNACLLEMARVFARHRDVLKRGIKFAWWPGHSVGRYSGSTWFADTFWEDLRKNCIAYLNIDSPGCRATTIIDSRYNNAEVESFIKEVVEEVDRQTPTVRRPFKAGDQSFWGLGIPNLGAYRMISPGHPERADVGGSGGGWWWHSPEDTLDKGDPEVLAADAKIYAAAAHRFCTGILLPLEFSHTAQDFIKNLTELQGKAKEQFDLTSPLRKAEKLREEVADLESLAEKIITVQAEKGENARIKGAAEMINRTYMKLGRVLNNVLYLAYGKYDQDPAVNVPLLPSLQPIARLVTLSPESDQFRFLKTRLTREKNRVSDALDEAIDEIERTMSWLESQISSDIEHAW